MAIQSRNESSVMKGQEHQVTGETAALTKFIFRMFIINFIFLSKLDTRNMVTTCDYLVSQ